MGIEDYFQSDDFAESLKSLKYIFEKSDLSTNSKIIEYFVSIAIKYSIFFGEEKDFSINGLNEFIEDVANFMSNMELKSIYFLGSNSDLDKYVSDLCIKSLFKRLNIEVADLLDENLKRGVCSFVIRNLKGKQFKFHAFNSAFYESIKENGINPNINFTSQQESDKINQIFEKYGINMIFGWQKLNGNGKVSYSRTPSVSYYYGTNSPEWFGQFTGQGFPFNPSNKYKKGAFVEGNYEAAKQNLLTLMNENHFSNDDLGNVIDFFETNWERYANKNPMLAIIPENINDEETMHWIEMILDDSYFKNDERRIFSFCFNDGEVDCQTSKTIEISDATFVELPNYNQLINKICFQQKNVDKKSSFQSDDEMLHKKLMFLAQSKIKIEVGKSGKAEWISDNGEQEVEKVKELLSDNEVYKAIISNKFGEELFLDGWIRYFESEIVNNCDNVKLLAKNKPSYFNIVSQENRSNIQLMRECASQNGVHPSLTCYVGDNVQNDFEFISNLIINSDENTFDFYGKSAATINGSNLRYGQSIGYKVRSNPDFWTLLNSKIMNINENTSRNLFSFCVEKELELVNNEFFSNSMNDSVDVNDNNQTTIHHR